MTVHDDSGVIGSRRGPAHVRLEVPVHDRQLPVGDTFSIPYVVRSTGDRRPERVSITAGYDERALEAVGATTRQLDLRARTTRGEFGFRARRAGSTQVLLTVKSTANRPGAEVAVRIDPAAAGGGGSGWWAALGALGLVLVAAAATIELVPRIQARRGTA